jgi:hypothetical protein
MKITTESVNPAFKPVRVEIILETREELDALCSLFNNGHISSALLERGCNSYDLWLKLRGAGANTDLPLAYYTFKPE